MPRVHHAIPCALAAALVSACASGGSMDAAYEQSLARWNGATRAALVAEWGKPVLEQATAGGVVLVYRVHHDFDNQYSPPGYTVVSAGPNSAPVVVARTPMLAGAAPVTCTTRFVLREERVLSWSFDGIGCGAPKQ